MHRNFRHRQIGQNFDKPPGGEIVFGGEPQHLGNAGTMKCCVLVNNAGVYRFEPLEAVTEKEFHREFDTNVLTRHEGAGDVARREQPARSGPAEGPHQPVDKYADARR